MSAFVLKIVAMIFMVVDHTGCIFFDGQWGWRVLGRLAFPLYSLMIVEGCRHLKDKENGLRRYLIFLGILAVISEPLYDFAFEGVWIDLFEQNQILQFFLFVVAFIICEKLKKPALQAIVWLVLLVGCFYFHIGFWSSGIVLMVMYLWYFNHQEGKSLGWKFGAATIMMLVFLLAYCTEDSLDLADLKGFGSAFVDNLIHTVKYRGVFLAIPFIALYNGTYGKPPKWFMAIYRYFYPAHLLVFCILQILLAAGA